MTTGRHGETALSCNQVVKVLQGYLDGEVQEEVARKVAGHLGDCGTCGLEAKALSDIKEALRRLGEPVDPKVLERLETYLRNLPSA